MRLWLILLVGLLTFALTACPAPEDEYEGDQTAIDDEGMKRPESYTEDEAPAEEAVAPAEDEVAEPAEDEVAEPAEDEVAEPAEDDDGDEAGDDEGEEAEPEPEGTEPEPEEEGEA